MDLEHQKAISYLLMIGCSIDLIIDHAEWTKPFYGHQN